MSDIHWAAGLFEGEGCFTPVKSGGRIYPRAVLAMADKDIVERFQDIVKVGHIRVEHRAPKRRDLYRWEVQRRDHFTRFCNTILPLLGPRRQQAHADMMATASPIIRPNHATRRR